MNPTQKSEVTSLISQLKAASNSNQTKELVKQLQDSIKLRYYSAHLVSRAKSKLVVLGADVDFSSDDPTSGKDEP
jgi:hypothetical protein